MEALDYSRLFINYFHIQLLIAELLLCGRLKRKRTFWPGITVGLAVYCILPYLFPQTFFWTGFMVGRWFTWGFIIMLMLSLLLMMVCFETSSAKELVFYGTAACVVQHLVHSTGRIYDVVCGMNGTMASQIVQMILGAVIYVLFYVIFVRRFRAEKDITVKKNYLMAFSIFSVVMIYGVSLWTSLEEVETVGGLLFDCFCCVLLLLLQFGLFEWSRLQKQNEMMKQILHMEQEQHAMSAENIELINQKCHDLKHQISALRYMDSRSEQDKSIEEIERAVMIYDMSVQTGNDTLDLILAEKGLYCEKYGIRFSCIADGKKLDFMSPPDIFALFGNAMDNAIECVCRLEEEEKRVISLHISFKGNCLVVHMENYNESPLEFEEGLPVTTKDDKRYHGYGMRSIRFLTEKYGGTLSIIYENHTFMLNILFPLS